MNTLIRFAFIFFVLFGTTQNSLKAQSNITDTLENETHVSTKKDFPLPSLKNISIGKFVKLSIGGQLREYYQFYNNEKWGNLPPSLVDKNGFYWHRVVLSSGWQFGKRIHLFTEFNSSLTSDRKGGNRPSIDYNQLDISKLYLGLTIWDRGKDNLKLKVGRQMYSFGSQRLITKREGPNNRLSFNGITVIYKKGKNTLTTFAAQPVYNKFYVFDDSVVKSQTIWGINLLHQLPAKAGKWELYYYGYSNSNIELAGKFGRDIRHSIGLFYTFRKNGWALETEPVLQLGRFNSRPVLAYSLFGQIQKLIPVGKTSIMPSLSLAGFSGDKKSNDKVSNTYSPMYPKPPFGLIAPLGPVNLLVSNPELNIIPNEHLLFSISSNIYFRESHHDGLYTPAVNPAIQQIYPGDPLHITQARFIGQDFTARVNYNITDYLSVSFEGGYFKAGDYLKQTGKGKNIAYISGKINFNF